MKFNSISLLVLGVLGVSQPAWSAGVESQFLCRPTSRTGAQFFKASENHLGGCTAKPDPDSGLCQEKVECAFITEEQREAIMAQHKALHPELKNHDYGSLSVEERISLLDSLPENKPYYRDTVVSCKGHLVGKVPTCPSPQLCKDETLVFSRIASIDYSNQVFDGKVADPNEPFDRESGRSSGAAAPASKNKGSTAE